MLFQFHNIFRKSMSTTQASAPSLPNEEVNTFSGSFMQESAKNSSGFRPIFYNNIVQNNGWLTPQLSYFLPAIQGATTLSSPSSTPSMFGQQAPSIGSDRWCLSYCQPFCSPLSYYSSMGEQVTVGEAPFVLVKHEEKSSNCETVHQSELNIRDCEILIEQTPKGSRRQKKKQIDKDYVPNRSQKKQPRKRLHENENRNVIPNQINQIISFLQKRNKSEHVLAKLWEKMPVSNKTYSITRFYLYQNMMKDQNGHYSNERQLALLGDVYEPECRVWELDQQRHYITLSRMLVGHFLRQDSIPIILTSKRMKNDKKAEHLRARREVARRVLELMKGTQ